MSSLLSLLGGFAPLLALSYGDREHGVLVGGDTIFLAVRGGHRRGSLQRERDEQQRRHDEDHLLGCHF